MTLRNIKTLFLLVLLISELCLCQQQKTIQSKIKTQKKYQSEKYQNRQLYSVEITRLASNKQSEHSACHTNAKRISVKSQVEIFRLKASQQKPRQETILSKITTLDDDQNIIEEFQIIGQQTFVITTNGKGYFLNEKSQSFEISTGLNLTAAISDSFFNVIIKNFKDRALIVSSKGISLCRSDQKNCVVLESFESVPYLFNAEILTQDSINYLFLMTGDEIIIYQITAGNQLKNKKVYNSSFFNVQKIHIRQMIKSGISQFLFLDSRKGILRVNYENKMSNFQPYKLVYEQPGCYQLSKNKDADQLVLACSLTIKSFFIQKLIKSYNYAEPHYEVVETIFTNEKIYDVGFVDNFIMSRIYSGVRLYWTSNKLSMPYPYDYNQAGNIFLHNALQSKLKIEDGVNVIYISTEDQIRKFHLKVNSPYVWCYSQSATQQAYKLTYIYPCQNPTPIDKICEYNENLFYTSWEHGQVKITTMLIPLGLSLIGAFVIVFVIFNVYKNYKNDIQRAKLKYQTQNEFGF